jgi:hypothetical protein
MIEADHEFLHVLTLNLEFCTNRAHPPTGHQSEEENQLLVVLLT